MYNKMEDEQGNGILSALYSITTGSAYNFREYNLFTDSFDVRDGNVAAADKTIMQRMIDFIKGMVNWRQMLEPEALLNGLNEAGINDSGSAIAFDLNAASEIFQAAQDMAGKEQAYNDADAALQAYLEAVGRYAVITINGEKYVLNGSEAQIEKDENGNYILNFDFAMKAGEYKDFTVEASTGSSIQFVITETYDGEAIRTTVNDVDGKVVEGVLDTGATYTFVNYFNKDEPNSPSGGNDSTANSPSGGNDSTANSPSGGNDSTINSPSGGNDSTTNSPSSDDAYDGPYSDDTTPTIIVIEDPEVPLGESEELEELEEPSTEIDEQDVPLTDVPGESVEIDELQVPLGDAPQTGDSNHLIPFVVLLLIAGTGLIVVRRKFQ
jgi:LPXTG-motif cell wall-anchored protein